MPRRRRSRAWATAGRRPLTVSAVSALTVATACATEADVPREPNVEIAVQMSEYDFVSDVVPELTEGDTARFVVENVGLIPHEVQILDTDAIRLGETGPVAAGDRTEVVVTFDEAGIYQKICDIDDHLLRGQRALFEVRRADGTSVLDD